MSKHSFKIALVFSLTVFVIQAITMALSGVLMLILLQTGVISTPKPELPLIIFAFISLVIGLLMSHTIGKSPLDVIRSIDTATKEVVKGNFTVQLDENISAQELQSMAHNFNVMVKELANTEIFRKDFIENVSHEFKTPLSAIEGYVTLLQKKSLSEEKRAEYTERILLNTRRLSTLTGNILLLSRLENQEIKTEQERFSLDEQLRECILMFEPQWTAKNLELDIDLCPVDYIGNPELLMQVWQNILGNSMKFVPEGGMIRVILSQDKNCVKVSIADNGIGMEKEVLDRIYEKFYQADASRAGSGNGLGLTLAKRIVDLHHGTITVSSKVKKGTAFTVSLPRSLPSEMPHSF